MVVVLVNFLKHIENDVQTFGYEPSDVARNFAKKNYQNKIYRKLK